jgi:hypothetical protein
MIRRALPFVACAALAITSLACGPSATDTDSHPVPSAPSFTGKLDLEIRGSADVTLTGGDANKVKATLTVTGAAAPHLLNDGTQLQEWGTVESVPEAGLEMFVAKLSLPADPDGPCAASPRAVALSLYHRASSPRFAGAITIYCGADHFGVPARVLRLSGTLTSSP